MTDQRSNNDQREPWREPEPEGPSIKLLFGSLIGVLLVLVLLVMIGVFD